MKNLLRFIALVLMVGGAYAQSVLPACPPSGYFHNCFGTFTYSSGMKYVGEWRDDKYNGQGALFYANGSTKQGIWADGVIIRSATVQPPVVVNQVTNFSQAQTSLGNLPACHGSNTSYWSNCFGSKTDPSGTKYVGEFKGGKRNGQGTFIFTNGNKYVGEWMEDKYNGLGAIYSSTGMTILEGIWSDDRFVRSAPVQQASVANQKVPLVALQPDNSERDKLLAEVEAERKKRQELEEQLKVAQQPTQPNRPAVSPVNDRRVALVIGNATYKNNPLKNPVNDSTDMARSLRLVGFDVIEANNTSLAQMREATRRFADKLGNSDVGLVYYSGHGVEVKGKNYLIPVNADIKREYEVVDQAFDASQFLEMMDNIRGPNNKRVNILIVDACRNNELQKSWRSTNNGLARMDAPGGTFISFATAPGRVAADGTGRNSPYTKHLLQALKQPNVPIEQVFKVVRRNVMEETKGEQIPWENSSLVGDFYFTVAR